MNLYLGGFPVDARGMHHLMQVENLPFSAGDERDMGLIPGSERSPGRGNGNPLQYSCLENPIDRGGWRATVYRFEKSQTRLKQLSMHAQITAHQTSLSLTICWSLPKFLSIESVMPSHHLILCHPLLLLPSIFSSIKIFTNESALHIRLPKYWSFSFNISPSNEYSGLIYFRIEWFDLLAVQGTLKSLLQHHNSNASIVQCSAFFMVQLSHLYMTTGKTIALTTGTMVSKVMSLVF